MKHHLIYIFILLFISVSFSQKNNQKFSLEEAIIFGLKNNRIAKNATNDIKVAKKRKWETTAIGLPQISAEIDYKNWLKQQINLIDINGDGIDDELIFGTSQTMDASATISQLLFDGSYLVGLQAAKVYLEISENAKIKTDLEIKKAITNAYGNVLLTEESIQVLKKNKSILEKSVYESQQIVKNGLAEEEIVEQLQITLSGIVSSLMNTIRLKNVAYQMLNITLGLDVNNPIVLTDTLVNLASQNSQLELLQTTENINTNIDYKIAENNKRAKKLLVQLEKAKALPTLSAFVNAGYTGNANQFDFLQSNQRWFGASLFGVNMSIPIFSSGKRNAITQQAKINLEKATNELLETEQQLKLQIAAAKSKYQFAIEDLENKKQNLNLAERIAYKNKIKFTEGITGSFELRQAQVQLYNAQQQHLQAMLNIINEKINLETVLN